jgi:hypothetical protein
MRRTDSIRTLFGNITYAALILACVGAVASPAFAQKSKKSDKSVDDMMEEPAESKAEPEEAAEEAEEEEDVEPDEWERPPVEEEEAPEPEPAPVVEAPSGDGRNLEVGLLLGYGFTTDKGTFGPDPYGLGFGLRAGYELDFKLFIGAGFEYYLGSSETRAASFGGVSAGSIDAAANYMFMHVEAGYDFWVSDVIIRPSLWLGVGIGTQDPHPISNKKKTVSDFFFGPAVSGLYTMESIFIGGDFRLHQVTGDGASTIAIYATGGMRF